MNEIERYRKRRDARLKKRMDAFKEGEHPRDESGRFTSGGGSSVKKGGDKGGRIKEAESVIKTIKEEMPVGGFTNGENSQKLKDNLDRIIDLEKGANKEEKKAIQRLIKKYGLKDGHMDSFNENDHPRDENGRFTSGGGSTSKEEKSSGSGGDFFKESWSESKGKTSKARDAQNKINKALEDFGKAEQKSDWKGAIKAGKDFAGVLDDMPEGVSITIRDHAVKPEYRDEGKITLKKDKGTWVGKGRNREMTGEDVWKMMDNEGKFDVEIDKPKKF